MKRRARRVFRHITWGLGSSRRRSARTPDLVGVEAFTRDSTYPSKSPFGLDPIRGQVRVLHPHGTHGSISNQPLEWISS